MALKATQTAPTKVCREHDAHWLVTMLTGLYLTTGISPAKVTIHLPPRKAVLVIESNEEDLVTSDDDSDIDQKQKHLTDTESEAEEMPRRIKHRRRAKQLWSISSDDAMSKLPKR